MCSLTLGSQPRDRFVLSRYPPRMKTPWHLLILATLIGGITPFAAKVALNEMPPLTVAWFRFGLAGILHLGTLRLRKKRLDFSRRDWLQLAGLGLICVPINQFFFLVGIKEGTASHAGLFYAMGPVLVFWASVLLRKSRFDGKMLFAALLAMAGAFVLLWPWGKSLHFENATGDMLLFGAIVSWAFFIVLSRGLIDRLGALRTLTATFLLGSLLHTPLILFDVGRLAPSTYTLNAWLGFGFITVVTSFLNYLMIYLVLARYEATRAMIVLNGSFLVTAALGWKFLGERIGWEFLGGALLISAAIGLDAHRAWRARAMKA